MTTDPNEPPVTGKSDVTRNRKRRMTRLAANLRLHALAVDRIANDHRYGPSMLDAMEKTRDKNRGQLCCITGGPTPPYKRGVRAPIGLGGPFIRLKKNISIAVWCQTCGRLTAVEEAAKRHLTPGRWSTRKLPFSCGCRFNAWCPSKTKEAPSND